MTEQIEKSPPVTPLMRQFYAIKDKHPDKILFFRMGDFYEMFGDDAVKAAPILGIALTSRSQGATGPIPLAGVPYHAGDKYLARLLASGEKVVIVEQVEDPKLAKGIVKREIVEILTPGTATIDSPENDHKPLCLASIFMNKKNNMGLAALDLSTGLFMIDEGPVDEIIERLKVLEPSEILYNSEQKKEITTIQPAVTNGSGQLTEFESWHFDNKTANRELTQHFGTTTLEGFGISNSPLAVTAAGAIFKYLKENHRDQLKHINKIACFDNSEYMM
ncbi:MAG: DNA mismatch repair protein MutS, partial [Candidatus Zixiibacteriota bacterium]